MPTHLLFTVFRLGLVLFLDSLEHVGIVSLQNLEAGVQLGLMWPEFFNLQRVSPEIGAREYKTQV